MNKTIVNSDALKKLLKGDKIMIEFDSIATSLYDGGWRSEDKQTALKGIRWTLWKRLKLDTSEQAVMI